MANTVTVKRKQALKRKLLAKLAGYTKLNGQASHGLLDKAIKVIDKQLSSGDPELTEKGVKATLQLLPYAIEKEDNRPLALINGQTSDGNTYLTLNQFIMERANEANTGALPKIPEAEFKPVESQSEPTNK